MPAPAAAKAVRADQVFPGRPVPPIVRAKTFSSSEWEEFIREWAHSLKSKYHTVLRCSSSGDMGRDVVAYTGSISSGKPWDNYQCKHYDHALAPGDIWIELGKLAYYTFLCEFTTPRAYFFVCPHDVGTTLARLLEQPSQLRAGLIANWDKKCRRGICSSEVKLEGKLKEHVEAFPFEIVSTSPVLKIIEEHRQTPWYVHRFGGGLPDRPVPKTPPDDIAPEEIPYLSELFRAYSDHEGTSVEQTTLLKFPALEKHFRLTRTSFFSAESLKAFSRDHLPENEFGRLQDEIRDGVQETYVDQHDDGYHKVRAVTKAAIDLQITDHALLPVLKPPDRRGICHQIVNDGHFVWVETNGEEEKQPRT
ncbi:MAG: ABC-three component system protein [Planctomycetaceae bacterium]